jgi:MFS family permease
MVHETHSMHGAPAGRWALASLALATLLPSLGSSIANVALPTLAASFATTFDAVQWVVLGYLMAMTVALMLAGWLGDRIGHRRLLVLGLVVFLAASVAGSVAPSLWLVVAARALQGIGAAIMVVVAMAFVSDVVPPERTGRAMGLLGAMSALGTALGPSLGGVLIEAFGWPSIFLANLPPAVVAVALARRHLPSARPRAKVRGRARDHISALLGPFRRRHLRAGFAATLIVSAVLMATLVVGPFHLSHAFALDAAGVGGVMSVGPIAAALLGVPAGRIVDRVGARRTTLLGLAGIAVGAALLALLPDTLGVPGYVLPIVAITASYALFQAANNTAVMRDAGPDQRGLVSGALNLSRNLGLIGGTSLMGAVFVAAGMHVTFGVGAALIVIAFAATSVRHLRRSGPPRWVAGSDDAVPANGGARAD